ncbi:MAG: glycine cleavage T C-terminal barrel domain-containing protein [Planctomycetota bacterium]
MAHPSPLKAEYDDRKIQTAQYGPPDAGIEIAESFGQLELEYAAIRRRCVLLDRPDRGLIVVRGGDRIDFLNNMVTQELATLKPGACTRSFWLNRKGRIDADLRIMHLEDRTLFDLDALTAPAATESLASFVFAEDCTLRDETQAFHRLELIGPGAVELIELASGRPAPEPDSVEEFAIDGVTITADREDSLGQPTIGLTTPAEHAAAVRDRLLELGAPAGLDRLGEADAAIEDDGSPASRIRLREAGWHAVNIARIEAGVPRMMLDFGPSNLPAETGVLDDRVSFTKGCYLGQEVVARMNALGHPKQTLVALRCEQRVTAGDLGDFLQPETGSAVMPEGDAARPIGAVTSATLSPALGRVPICFAQVKWGHHEPGTVLTVDAEGVFIRAIVQETLRSVEV